MYFPGTRTPFTSVIFPDESELPAGSEIVPLDTEVVVYQEQKGFFPTLEPIIPLHEHLDVIVTRSYDVVDKWVAKREAEGPIYELGYQIHTKKHKKKASVLAYVTQEGVIN